MKPSKFSMFTLIMMIFSVSLMFITWIATIPAFLVLIPTLITTGCVVKEYFDDNTTTFVLVLWLLMSIMWIFYTLVEQDTIVEVDKTKIEISI